MWKGITKSDKRDYKVWQNGRLQSDYKMQQGGLQRMTQRDGIPHTPTLHTKNSSLYPWSTSEWLVSIWKAGIKSKLNMGTKWVKGTSHILIYRRMANTFCKIHFIGSQVCI